MADEKATTAPPVLPAADPAMEDFIRQFRELRSKVEALQTAVTALNAHVVAGGAHPAHTDFLTNWQAVFGHLFDSAKAEVEAVVKKVEEKI